MAECFILPWTDDSDVRVASTWDINHVLQTAEPGSYDEFAVCYEVAFDEDRPLDERERYMIATYGKEYIDDPKAVNAKYDDLAERARRNVGKYAIIQKSPTFLILGKLADPNIHFYTQIGRAANVPMGYAALNLAGRISTIIDDQGKVVPELSRDFVEWPATPVIFEERGTDVVWREDLTFDCCEHNGDNQSVILGNEIEGWLAQNPVWLEHVDNMMSAYTTRGVNVPVAKLQPFENSLWVLEK
jgi:hypothetical protein